MSEVKSIQDSMRNGWKSRRLTYRAFQDDNADQTFIHEAIACDPTIFALTNSASFQPQSKSMTAAFCAMLRKKSLSVVICLPLDALPGADRNVGSENPETSQNVVETENGVQGKASTKVPIGILTLTAAEPESHHHRQTMLGINIIDDYQGHGYGPEAINWGLDWAFKFGGMHRVGLTCYGYNDRGKRLYEKLGFIKEGTVRECLWFDRAWHDEIYYGMLESEWEKLRSSE